MACISTLDHQTRLDVHELLARYCQFMDHDRGECWASLFTADGVFEKASGFRLEGTQELATFPAKIHAVGGGCWRHVVTNVTIDRCPNHKDVIVNAYVMVMDWAEGGKPVGLCDTRMVVRRANAWRIARVDATPVGVDGEVVALGSAPVAMQPA
jgi:hypothetical protein